MPREKIDYSTTSEDPADEEVRRELRPRTIPTFEHPHTTERRKALREMNALNDIGGISLDGAEVQLTIS